MFQLEYMIYPLIMNHVTKSEYNIYYGIIMFLIYFIFKYDYIDNIKIYLLDFFLPSNTKKIVIKNEDKDRSIKFKALMFFLEKNYNDTIKKISTNTKYEWNRDDEKIEKPGVYEISQSSKFTFTNEIYGTIVFRKEEESRTREHTNVKKICDLNIMSDTKSLNELKKWIDEKVKDYKYYLKMKSYENQLLLTINYNEEEKCIDIEKTEWESTVSFQNSYFQNKDNILQKIDFFLKNKKWYYDKGIPYNLGILLYGEPGCGKTRFIKQLMNYTKRHGIDIKLNDSFDFTKLKDIIYNEEIENEYVIPQDKRIIIFEDIDAIGNVIKDRDLLNKQNPPSPPMINNNLSVDTDESENVCIINKNTKNKQKMLTEINQNDKKKNSNNLSYFLNILDGLNECSGRIIIMTTNKIDHLDKALIRPGRIDIKINFTKCSCYDIYMMIKSFWGDDIDITLKNINSELENKYTSAEIINIFRSSMDFKNIKHHFI
jgi:SpoVK/Ycf46/Vps4 family AAA+-type ATPase